MAKHLIVYGHGQGDPGAVGNGYCERDFTRNVLGPYLEKYARQLKNNTVDFYDKSLDMYTQTRAGRGAYSVSGYASVTELHLDAASPAATGGHVIVKAGFSADSGDLGIAQVIKKYVGWWGSVAGTQGISYRNDLLNLNVFANRGISYRLAELGFITNANDVRNLKNNLDAIAKEMIKAITGESVSGGGSTAPSTPKPAPKPQAPSTGSGGYKYAVGTHVTFGGVFTDSVSASKANPNIGYVPASRLTKNNGTITRQLKVNGRSVYLIDNGFGWINDGDVSSVGGSAPKPSAPTSNTTAASGTYTVTSSVGSNLRTGPGTNYSIIATLPKGSVVKYDQKIVSGGYTWLRQPRGGNTYGYIAML